MPTISFQHSKVDPYRHGYNTNRKNMYVAVVTDDGGKKWDWTYPIIKGVGTYQGPMGMMGATHESTTWEVHGYGTVPGLIGFDTGAQEYILERFKTHRGEFLMHR